jgi:ligand-binding sensor domain-containing protein
MGSFFSSFCGVVARLLLLCVLGVPSGRAAPEDFLAQAWDTDQGLPDSTVMSIAQTPDGYLWVGTRHGGLARFDGQRFVTFHPGNTPELRSIEIHKLVVDPQGTLWVGTVEGALVSYRNGQFHFELQNQKTPPSWLDRYLSSTSDSVVLSSYAGWLFQGTAVNGTYRWETPFATNSDAAMSAFCDRQGTIWYRTKGSGLGQLRNHQFVRLPNPPGLRGRQVHALLTDAVGQLWVGTERELARWDGTKFVNQTPTNGAPELNVQRVTACPDGSFWVQAGDDVRKMRDQQWLTRVETWDGGDPQPSAYSLELHGDSRGGLWVLHRGDGLWHADASGRISRIGAAQGLPNTLFNCWLEDREGNIWMGLDGGGLVCVRERIFHTVWPAAKESRLGACSICEDQAGAMWFGTSEGNLLRWREGEFTNFNLPILKTAGYDAVVFPGDTGQLWAGNVRNGVVVLDHEQIRRPFPAEDIGSVDRVLYQDRAGRIWLGSEAGLFCWEAGKLKHFTEVDRFPNSYVEAITEDPSGQLWVGCSTGELRRYAAGKFTTFVPADSQLVAQLATLPEPKPKGDGSSPRIVERFWALYADADGVLWIGSLGGGLLRFQDGKFTRFTSREGLSSDHVSQILEDAREQLWLGTADGIVQVSKAELNRFARGDTDFVRFVARGRPDGMPTTECSGGCQPGCWRSRDGHLWFATVKGAVWTDPAEVRLNAVPPPVVLEEVSVDGQRIGADGQPSKNFVASAPARLTVSPGRHYLEFKFTAPSFTSPDRVRFKWRLAGLEADWTHESDRRLAGYGFVPPGHYEFQVRACNGDGAWNETGASVKLTVQPHFWQTWWFLLLVGLAVGTGLWAIHFVRVSRLRALEHLRLRIARDLHDEVGSDLNTISLLAQILETNLKLENHPSQTDATQVRGIAAQTFDSLRDIIWFIDPTHDKLSDLVARLEMITRQMLPTLPHTFERLGEGEVRDTGLPMTFRRNAPPLFKEALHNLLRHSRATQAAITVGCTAKQFNFKVQDNGVGFDPKAKSSGNGLKNMKRRALEMGGRLEILSSPGGGTTVMLIVPIP